LKDSTDDFEGPSSGNKKISKKKTKQDLLYNNSIIQNSLDNNSKGSKLNDDIYSRHLSLEESMHSHISELIKQSTISKVAEKEKTENNQEGSVKRVNEDQPENKNENQEKEKEENIQNNNAENPPVGSNDIMIKSNTNRSKPISQKENKSNKSNVKEVDFFIQIGKCSSKKSR
jgi:hypothetical protein